MPIGYYNYSTLQQGGENVIKSMASLGQQIAGSIENHAQTQAATAMLPALQQSYQQGMQKIAHGDPNGMSDIYSAASTASQIPMLQSFAQNAITTGQSANLHVQEAAKTKAYLQGQQISSMASHPEMFNSDGTLNTSRLGQAAPAKPYTPYQQEQIDRNSAKDRNDQLDEYSQLYNGQTLKDNTKVLGIGGYADKINDAIKEGKDVNPEDLQNFAQRYKYYKQKQLNYGKNALNYESIDKAYDNIKDHLTVAKGDLDKKIEEIKKKGEDPTKVPVPSAWFGNIWPDKKDLLSVKTNLEETINNLENIRNIGKQGKVGGIPAAGGQTYSQALMQAVQAAKRHPDKIDIIKSRLQGAGIDPSMLDQAIKSQQTQQQSSPQASNMIPAANQTSDDVETEEEE